VSRQLVELLSEELHRATQAKEAAVERWRATGAALAELETGLAQSPNIALESLLLPAALPQTEDGIQ
jgi:hypothetical protein